VLSYIEISSTFSKQQTTQEPAMKLSGIATKFLIQGVITGLDAFCLKLSEKLIEYGIPKDEAGNAATKFIRLALSVYRPNSNTINLNPQLTIVDSAVRAIVKEIIHLLPITMLDRLHESSASTYQETICDWKSDIDISEYIRQE
jgi:hypothetical protein